MTPLFQTHRLLFNARTAQRSSPPPCGEGRRGGGRLNVSRRQTISRDRAHGTAPLTLPSPYKGERGCYAARPERIA
jgi:hypothetical protein